MDISEEKMFSFFYKFSLGHILERTRTRDPDLEENGQKKKGERNNES